MSTNIERIDEEIKRLSRQRVKISRKIYELKEVRALLTGQPHVFNGRDVLYVDIDYMSNILQEYQNKGGKLTLLAWRCKVSQTSLSRIKNKRDNQKYVQLQVAERILAALGKQLPRDIKLHTAAEILVSERNPLT